MGLKQYLLGAAMVLIAIIGIVAGGEILVRFTAPQNLNGTWLKVGPRGLRINKAGGTAQHQLGARVIRYNFNSLHQRGAEPGKGGIRVLVLGDSFTFGWLVGEDKSFVGRLQIMADKRFGPRRIRFLNAGTGGWGTTDALAYLEWMGPKIAPDAVLVMLNFDDIPRNRHRKLYRLRPNRGLELEAGSVEVPGVALKRWVHRFIPGYQWLLEHSHLFQLLRRTVIEVFNLDTPPTSAEIPPEFMAAIDAFPGDKKDRKAGSVEMTATAGGMRSVAKAVAAIADRPGPETVDISANKAMPSPQASKPVAEKRETSKAAIADRPGPGTVDFSANKAMPSLQASKPVAELRETSNRIIQRLSSIQSKRRRLQFYDALFARALFRRIRQWCERNGVRLFVVATGWPLGYYQWASPIMAAERIPFYDLYDTVGKTVLPRRETYKIPYDGHPNEAAHKLIADTAWRWLEPRLGALRPRASR